jgi:hypothetical protein
MQHEPQRKLRGVEGPLQRGCRALRVNLKMERVWQRQYASHAEAKAKADMTDCIVGFYNGKRINSALGNAAAHRLRTENGRTQIYRCVRNYLSTAQCRSSMIGNFWIADLYL